LHELPRTTVIVSVQTTNAAHIAEQDRATFDRLGHEDGICQVKLCYGFHDPINVPLALKNMHSRDPERIFSLEDASYFVSLSKVIPSRSHEMALWRKKLFALLARNELSTSDYYRLPIDRTEEMTTLMRL
jgi:KUP system potassium uptake protein